jgi:hypothetical protein
MLPRMERAWQLLVGGQRRDARTGRTATISEPGTGKPLAEARGAGHAMAHYTEVKNVYFSSQPHP